jgi:GNAT superfamily N-acetyltransferase
MPPEAVPAFRLIEEGDLPGLFDLRAVTRENPFSREALRELGITEASTAEKLRTTHRGWLAEVGGRKAGFAIGDGSTGELTVIAVAPGFEGNGIGSRLLKTVEAWLASKGREELWLWTSSDPKARAYSFYLRRGWIVSEARADIVYMRKKMKTSPAMPSSPPDPEAVVQRQLEAYNAHDVEAFVATYAEDAELHTHFSELVTKGSAEIRARYEARFRDNRPHAVIVNRIILGNTVIDHEEVTATFGTTVSTSRAVVIYEVKGAAISHAWLLIEKRT